MKIKLILFFIILATGILAESFSDQEVKDLILKNQNLICNYKSITLSENITYNDTMQVLPRINYELLINLTNIDSLMIGMTKFPFLDENIWLYSFNQDSLIVSSITTNNSKIDYYLQDIHFVFNNDLSAIKRLVGRIYTKLSMYENDCEYFLYKAYYSIYDNIFLPDSVSYFYYSQQDTTLSQPALSISNNYKLTKSNCKEFVENKWIKKFDCSQYKITKDEALLQRFFKDKVFEEKICFLTDELMSWQRNFEHIGATIDSTVIVTFKNIKKYAESRVWKVTLNDEEGNGTDYYVQLVNESGNVKISKIRSFVLPNFYYIMADSLLSDPNSTAEDKYLANSIILQSSTDNNLKDHFKKNKRSFKNLLKMYKKDKDANLLRFDPFDSEEILNPEYSNLLKKLQLWSVRKNDNESIIYFSLGGHLDNDVGFLYCKEKSELPLIFKSNYILVEKICKHWYLYKTT